MHRIRPDLHQDVCPDCNRGPHDTAHLMCPANPTDLDPWSLWEDPARAAIFLGLRTGGEVDELDDNDLPGYNNNNILYIKKMLL